MIEKKRWQFFLIIGVCFFTLYNILPNFFYYFRTKNDPVSEKQGERIISNIISSLHEERENSVLMLKKLAKISKTNPLYIIRDKDLPSLIMLAFRLKEEAETFSKALKTASKHSSLGKNIRFEDLSLTQEGFFIVKASEGPITNLKKENFSFCPIKTESFSEDFVSKVRVFLSLLLKANRCEESCPCFLKSDTETHALTKTLLGYHNINPDPMVFSQVINFFFPDKKDFLFFRERLQQVEKTEEIEKLNSYWNEYGIIFNSLRKETIASFLSNLNVEKIKNGEIFLNNLHPLINKVLCDEKEEKITLFLNDDIDIQKLENMNSKGFLIKELTDLQSSFKNTVSFSKAENAFSFSFKNISDKSSSIIFDSSTLVNLYQKYFSHLINIHWNPATVDFYQENFPQRLSYPERKFGYYIFSPENSCRHFKKGSLYVLFRGFKLIENKYNDMEECTEKSRYQLDVEKLYKFFMDRGFELNESGEDLIFSFPDIGKDALFVSKEKFSFLGDKAYLDLSTQREREEIEQNIATQAHEELISFHDEYAIRSREISYLYPPLKRIFFNNCLLNIKKYFKGERKKLLKWGLDLSGGKSLKLVFKNENNQIISSTEDLQLAYQELSAKLNRLGVSEISVRREGSGLSIDLPSNKSLEVEDILSSSKMTFHVVNEKFNPYIGPLAFYVKEFLQEVWNEAKIYQNISLRSLNDIAFRKISSPDTEASLILSKEKLKFADSKKNHGSDLDETYSMIVLTKDQSEVPLLIVFKNYALEGTSLKDIRIVRERGEGPSLSFSVSNKHVKKDPPPKEILYKWTNSFCEKAIRGTSKEKYSLGRGWRMAVILNGHVVSSPSLNSSLKEGGRITGNFSEKELKALEMEIKTGSLSFHPQVVSEDIISPELGTSQRNKGLLSMALGLSIVLFLMAFYYRFGGVIAGFAVIISLFIICAVLQSIGAVLTLSGLAGVILAVGMAVDANVLVFERMREEIEKKQTLIQSLEKGYKKTLGAIWDSNITTILASSVFLFLDSGPIKGFTITLFVGVAASMFTSLFLTKFFFSWWLSGDKPRELRMRTVFNNKNINFFACQKYAWFFSLSLITLGVVSFVVFTKNSLIGLDFKGGYVCSLELKDRTSPNVKDKVNQLFKNQGLSAERVNIQVLNKGGKLRIYLDDFSAKALINNPTVNRKKQVSVDSLGSMVKTTLSSLNLPFNESKFEFSLIGSKFSKKMSTNAFIASLFAMIIILLYVTFRFERLYAISAIVALIHDLLATCSFLSLIHIFVQQIQFDLQAIGALMTVLGYSLNNTIIIFDRIRENKNVHYANAKDLINNTLNATLSRTVMTTLTTVAVLICLLICGSGSTFSFSIIITGGIILGTLSSFYIAPSLFFFLNQKKQQN